MPEYDYSIEASAQSKYNYYQAYGPCWGTNGIPGFKQFECYMLIKYGKPNKFGVGGDYEYLIEIPAYPEQVTESITPSWEKQDPLGRSSSIAAYAHTSLKTVNFDLDLHRDFLTGSYSLTSDVMWSIGGHPAYQSAGKQKQSPDGPFDTRTWYVSMNKMLQMACYPQYTSSGLIPPTTYFIFGQMILKGFVTSYSTTWKKPIINTFYGWNSVQITMDCYPDFVVSARDLIENYSSSSTQNTYNTNFPSIATVGANVIQRDNMRSRTNYRTDDTVGGQVIDVR